jgi:hypothetical protein
MVNVHLVYNIFLVEAEVEIIQIVLQQQKMVGQLD